MGGKADPPDPPNYSQIANASKKAAKLSYKMAKKQLKWAKKKYRKDSAVAKTVINAALKRQRMNDKFALQDRRRYENKFQPLENKLIRDAKNYSTPGRQQMEAAKAQADVAQQFDASRQRALSNLQSYGVDPSSLRYASMDRAANVQQGAAQSAAGNQARQQTEAIGRALRAEAINVGRGYPGQIAGTYGTALQSGNQGINSALATTASGANTMGTPTQWMGSGNQALGTWGNALNSGFQNEMMAYNAQQNASSGIGGIVGTALGIGASFLSEGGEVTSGGNVPRHASPSGGKAIDDVPARLTAGEFVVPKDVVSWKGEEFFQKLIEGSRKAKPEAPAKPQYALAAPQQPTFQSRPSALPSG